MKRIAPLAIALAAALPAQAQQLQPLDAGALKVLGVEGPPAAAPPPAQARRAAPVLPQRSTRLVPMPVTDPAHARANPLPPPPGANALPRQHTAGSLSLSAPDATLPEPVAEPTPPPKPRKTFEVNAGDMASDVFRRWLETEGLQLVWQTSRDFRLEAGARFQEHGALDAIRAVSEVLGRSHPDFVVRAFANGVVVVMDKT